MPLGIAPQQISSRRAPILRSNRSQLVFDPELDPRQVNATSIHLRLDYKFLEWDFKKGNPSSAVQHNPHIVFNRPIAFSELETTYGKMKMVEPGEVYPLGPGKSVLAWTYEGIAMLPHLAGRIEGRRTLARLGLTIHNTAPTIHPGFGYSRTGERIGYAICLELRNASPDPTLDLMPASLDCCISQLTLERVSSPPERLYYRKGQYTP